MEWNKETPARKLFLYVLLVQQFRFGSLTPIGSPISFLLTCHQALIFFYFLFLLQREKKLVLPLRKKERITHATTLILVLLQFEIG